MLSKNELLKIGREACFDWLGRENVNRDNGCTTWGYEANETFYCAYAYDPAPFKDMEDGKGIVIDDSKQFPYVAYSYVDVNTGTVYIDESISVRETTGTRG